MAPNATKNFCDPPIREIQALSLGSISSTFYLQLLLSQIPKALKKTVKLSIFFTLSGSRSVIAAHKTLVKLTVWQHPTVSSKRKCELSFITYLEYGAVCDKLGRIQSNSFKFSNFKLSNIKKQIWLLNLVEFNHLVHSRPPSSKFNLKFNKIRPKNLTNPTFSGQIEPCCAHL